MQRRRTSWNFTRRKADADVKGNVLFESCISYDHDGPASIEIRMVRIWVVEKVIYSIET